MQARLIRCAMLLLALAVAGSGAAMAQPAQAQADASALVAGGLFVMRTADLQFGSLLAGAGGTVTITETGARSTTGGVVPVASPFSAAAFFVGDIDNKGNRKFAFTVIDASIVLTRVAGTETMTVNAFTNDSTLCQPCSRTPLDVHVGATLTIGANQMPGTYVGTFNVRVDEP